MPRISLSWVVVLGLLSAIGPLCTDFYLPALPEITQQLSATGTQTQLSLTAALIGLGLALLIRVLIPSLRHRHPDQKTLAP